MKKIVFIILLIIWMITVFLFSSEKGEISGATSGNCIKILFKILNKEPTKEQIQKLQLPIRKLAHFTLYAIGGVVSVLLITQYNLLLSQKIIYSQLIISIYAATDEFHQYFIPGRTALVTDVLIDSLGGFVGIILIALLFIK